MPDSILINVTQPFDLDVFLPRIKAVIILDLRDDPGGLVDESIGVVSQFLNSGNVLQGGDTSVSRGGARDNDLSTASKRRRTTAAGD